MRGHTAQRAAIILLMGLLLVLVASFFHGVSSLKAWGRIRKGSEGVGEIREATQRLLQFHPHIKGVSVFAAVDYLAEQKGVVQFELEGCADGDGALQFEPNPAC